MAPISLEDKRPAVHESFLSSTCTTNGVQRAHEQRHEEVGICPTLAGMAVSHNVSVRASSHDRKSLGMRLSTNARKRYAKAC